MKMVFLWFMTPCSLVVKHQNFGKMRCLDLNLKYIGNSWWWWRQHGHKDGHKDVVFASVAFTSLQPSSYTVPPSLLLHAAPLTLKGICSWVCLKPLLANVSSYCMHNNAWATSGSELLSSNWSLIAFRNPITSGVTRNFVRRGEGGFNKFSWGQRERGSGGGSPPSQGFWRQL